MNTTPTLGEPREIWRIREGAVTVMLLFPSFFSQKMAQKLMGIERENFRFRVRKTEDFFQERGYEKLHGKKKRFLDGHVYGLLWSTDSAL